MKPLENETLKEYLNRCITIVNGDVNDKELIKKYTIQYNQYKRGVSEYELYIDDFVDGLVGVSLVDDPAIEMNFIMFSKNKEPKVETKFSISDNEKQVISGPALIPEQRIYRYNEETGEEFFVYFTAETIEKSLTKFMQSGFFNNVNLQHQVEIDGVHLFESWLVSNPENDKAVEMGYDVPKGTWMISFKIENPILWKEFKENNTINGFSIEGYFSRRTTDEITEDDKTLEEIIKILKTVDETRLAADDLNDKYKWVTGGDEPCPICNKNSGQTHTLKDWLRRGVPRVKNGASFKGHKTNYATSPYATYCEENCHCKLVKV